MASRQVYLLKNSLKVSIIVLLGASAAQAQDTTAAVEAAPVAVEVAPAPTPAPVPAPAPVVSKPSFTIGGEYRPRVEVRNDPTTRYLGKDPHTNVVFSHRARLKGGVEWKGFGVTLTPQDVRQWGSELSTLAVTSPVMEMHEAYAQYATTNVLVRIGRQEFSFDDERLIGAVGWAQQGRAFDGARVGWRATDGSADADLFGAVLELKTKPLTPAPPAPNPATDKFLVGAHGRYAPIKGLTVSGLGVMEKGMRTGFDRYTFGPRVLFNKSNIVADAAAYYQLGTITPAPKAEKDLQAWMAGLRLGYDDPKLFGVLAGIDMLSGDNAVGDKKVRSFDTLYATGHKWYGTMDYFTVFVPDATKNHTAGLGLNDAVVTLKYAGVNKLKLQVDQHFFGTNQETPSKTSHLGAETDLTVDYGINQYVKISGGYSLFSFGDAMSVIKPVIKSGDLGHWSWLMTSFQL